ncbi:hypothetical protein R1flu_003543 [Riccia fluitans]|uniref:Uncharacterized protein n=1 Tax=Riccia fluitans TaxID=41844 RepID=A0ABD1Y9A7_9MARC
MEIPRLCGQGSYVSCCESGPAEIRTYYGSGWSWSAGQIKSVRCEGLEELVALGFCAARVDSCPRALAE